MGRRIVALAAESGRFDIVGALESEGHLEIGKDAGLVAGIERLNVPLGSSWPAGASIAIDFSLPEAADRTLQQCTAGNTALVLGTTGLTRRPAGSDQGRRQEDPHPLRHQYERRDERPVRCRGQGGRHAGRGLRHRDRRRAPPLQEGRPQRQCPDPGPEHLQSHRTGPIRTASFTAAAAKTPCERRAKSACTPSAPET